MPTPRSPVPLACRPLLLVALLAPPVAAQQAAGGDLLAGLRAPRSAQRAWAAHRIAATGDERFTPHLLRALAELRGSDRDRDKLLRRLYASALVELDAELPGPELLRLAEWQPVEALWLAARRPRQYEPELAALLERRWSDLGWVALCGLLLERRSPALAPHLLAELEVAFVLVVHDGGYGGEGRAMFSSADGAIAVPADFPPVPYHKLVGGPAPDPAWRVTGEPYPVHVERVMLPPGKASGVGRAGRRVDKQVLRVGFLRALADDAGAGGLVAELVEDLVWTGGDSFLEAVASGRAELAGRWQGLVERLVEQRLLDRGTATAPPRVRVAVRDRRRDPQTPLPPVPAGGGPLLRVGSVLWLTDYEQALRYARTAGKPLWMHFGEHPG